NYAYVTTGSTVDVLDLSQPTNPVVVAQIDANPRDVSVWGHYLYLTEQWTNSTIYNVSNPTNPVLAGELPAASSVAVVDHYVYLAMNFTNTDGLGVYDISDVANPTMVTFVSSLWPYGFTVFRPNILAKIVVAGNSLFATAYGWHYSTICLFDISNRTNPLFVNRLVGQFVVSPAFPEHRLIAVSGNYLYSVGESLTVYDVSDLANAYTVASLEMPSGAYGYALAVRRNYAYTVQYGQIGVFSLGSPTPPPLEIHPAGI